MSKFAEDLKASPYRNVIRREEKEEDQSVDEGDLNLESMTSDDGDHYRS